jgi:hypothetical protein
MRLSVLLEHSLLLFPRRSHRRVTATFFGTHTMQANKDIELPSRRQGDCILFQGPLFGRLTKAGKDLLLRNGWTFAEDISVTDKYATTSESQNTRKQRLALVWPSKSGPQFELKDATGAHIRPFPKVWTDTFDDKLLLAQALEGTSLSPPCIKVPLPDDIALEGLYFVKHRYGAQGKSVYVYNPEELLEWYAGSQNSQDFVIQHEILPSLYQGRKFVLRCHILLLHRYSQDMKAFLHQRSIVCQHHSTKYKPGVSEKSSQVSQAGKKHPPPILLQDLEPDHPAANAYDEIHACSQNLLNNVLKTKDKTTTTTTTTTTSALALETTCFALLGTDLVIDDRGKIKICEVNSHPALGWGTMCKVPSHVFITLIEETLSMLLARNTEEEFQIQELTGFHSLLL